MVLFDNLEDIFQSVRDLSDNTKALVTLATALGALVAFYFFIKLLIEIIDGFRLYVLSQLSWFRVDYVKRYGQWAVVTGATDGIGLSMAKELARRGHSIILVARNADKLATVKEAILQEPNVGEVETVKIDLSDSSVQNFSQAVAQIKPDEKDIGILINNAGTFPARVERFANNDPEYLRTISNVNNLALVLMTRFILPSMINRGKGLVINVSSLFGKFPSLYLSIYGPTKTFIDTFSKLLQTEYQSYPIDIINLIPGSVHTRLFRDLTEMSQPGTINPTPDEYAKSALNAVSTRMPLLAGYWLHGIMAQTPVLAPRVYKFFYELSMKFFAKDVNLSPVPRRKGAPTNPTEAPLNSSTNESTN